VASSEVAAPSEATAPAEVEAPSEVVPQAETAAQSEVAEAPAGENDEEPATADSPDRVTAGVAPS
jgi:hypothetical protein